MGSTFDLLRWLYEHPDAPLAVDTETTGLLVADGRSKCIGVSFTARIDGTLYSDYIPFNHAVGTNRPEEMAKLSYVLRQGRPLIFVNVQFDWLSLETIGIRVSEQPFYDVPTIANLVREDFPYMKDLDSLYKHYVKGDHGKMKEWAYAIFDEGRKTPRQKTTLKWQKENGWPHTTPEMMHRYACDDTEATYEIWEALMVHAAWQEQPASVWEKKQDLIRTLVEVRRRGIEVNVELAEELEVEGEIAKEGLLEKLGGLNPSSANDAPKIFLDMLNLPVLKMTEGGKDPDPEKRTPKPSFTKAVLEEHDKILEARGDTSPEVGYVRAWRGWTTAMGLLLRPYQALVSPDGRLRTSYTTHVTSTGRLSSKEPNLQQISKEGKDPWNNRVKKCFRARPGYTLLSADYSQLELRLAVAYAQEPALQEIFLEGRDIFTEMSLLLGWERPKTKSFVYATQYGGGVDRIAYIFGVTKTKAKELRENYYRTYPKFRKLDAYIKAQAEDKKKIRLWSGRIRHFRNSSDSYKALNALLQGGAADVVEQVWVYVMKHLDNPDCRALLQVHDALVFEVKDEYVEHYMQEIQAVMEDVNGICGDGEELFPVKFAVEVTVWE